MKIPFGMLGEYKKYVSEYINRIKEKDSGTLQFDWYISSDKTVNLIGSLVVTKQRLKY